MGSEGVLYFETPLCVLESLSGPVFWGVQCLYGVVMRQDQNGLTPGDVLCWKPFAFEDAIPPFT